MNPWLQARAKKLFFRSLQNLSGGFLEIVCPDETYTFGEADAELRAMAVIHDERFFMRALTGADIGMGESYMDGDWTTPDLVALVRVAVRNLRLLDAQHKVFSGIRAMASRLHHRLRGNTIKGSRKNIRAHYDLGNEFYRLFLDSEMVYSCAYFRHKQDSLEAAQLEKLDLACRKLHIRPGDRVLEIGCGWGSFAIHAARNYGAHVTGVTISPAQYEYATQRVEGVDLGSGSARIVLEDYRRVQGQYDKIASIEMFEAVGFDHYDEFFGMCDRLLTPEGSMFLQTITLREQEIAEYRKRVDWIQTYIFPGGELASVVEIGRSLVRSGQLNLTNTESISTHYAKTLALWRERFFCRIADVRRLGFDERFQRMWDFYLGWCEGAFREHYIGAAQLVISKKAARERILGEQAVPSASALSA
ncbi:MAG: cyclopropane-fatty-acyl-phospholipid synthase family protein [Candidatus Acidiferrum sp.]|jgi:cyclopropane-fatty-acyl-phospholipid synthase